MHRMPDFIKIFKSFARSFLHSLNRPIVRSASLYPFNQKGWGGLRRLQPISRKFGLDRGQAIDRYYIEAFLQQHEKDITGHVLEVGDNRYTKMFGGDQVTKSEVLHVTAGNPIATIVGDLSSGLNIPSQAFDCIILTQVYQFLFDIQSAIRHTYNALKTGGVLLATMSGISQISRYDMDRWGDYWRFTDVSLSMLFANVFGEDNMKIDSHGNVLVACAFLHGMAVEELTEEELGFCDPDYQLLITLRAVKRNM